MLKSICIALFIALIPSFLFAQDIPAPQDPPAQTEAKKPSRLAVNAVLLTATGAYILYDAQKDEQEYKDDNYGETDSSFSSRKTLGGACIAAGLFAFVLYLAEQEKAKKAVQVSLMQKEETMVRLDYRF